MIKPEAVLFDLDGVLCDTSEYHFLAWKRLADELGLRFIRMDNERLKGVSRLRSFEIILEINGRQAAYSENEKNRLANRKNAYYKDLIEQMAPAIFSLVYSNFVCVPSCTAEFGGGIGVKERATCVGTDRVI